jgi:3-(3-hydroxy-phenyl)propionate hydroxylase
MPPLVGGLFDGERSGELFPQPMVAGADERLQLMDDAAGTAIVVVALAPLAAVLALSGLDAIVVSVGVVSVPGVLRADSPDLAAWFDDREVKVAVLRPDRYVYGVSDNVDRAIAIARQLSDALFPARVVSRQ